VGASGAAELSTDPASVGARMKASGIVINLDSLLLDLEAGKAKSRVANTAASGVIERQVGAKQQRI
jgi:hypothetical protein